MNKTKKKAFSNSIESLLKNYSDSVKTVQLQVKVQLSVFTTSYYAPKLS